MTNATLNQPTEAAPRPEQRLLASFGSYRGAQELVDRMSDDGFPVQHLRIVGDEVRTVEQVTGRMTTSRAAAAGAATGAWIGALIGLLFLIFSVTPLWLWIYVLLLPMIIGAIWGAALGYVAHWSTRGKRDFSSVWTLEARRYDVYVDTQLAEQAAPYAKAPDVSEQTA